MTDRINALTVVLAEDIREDDAEGLINAMLQMRHVLSVKPNVSDPLAVHVAEQRVTHDLMKRMLAILGVTL
jgi:hypothetical protein